MSSRYAIPMIRFARSARHGCFGRISWCATDLLESAKEPVVVVALRIIGADPRTLNETTE
jgi:hypothetical protein